MARLRGGVDDGVGAHRGEQGIEAAAVADVHLMMRKPAHVTLQSLLVPAGIAARTKEHRALIAVEAVDLPAQRRKVHDHFGANEPRRPRNKQT